MVKYIQSQKTGEWLPIGPEDMDYTRYGKTLEELIVERDAINKIVYGTKRFKTWHIRKVWYNTSINNKKGVTNGYSITELSWN